MAEPNRGPRSNKSEDKTVTEAHLTLSSLRSSHIELKLPFLSCRSFAEARTKKLGLCAH